MDECKPLIDGIRNATIQHVVSSTDPNYVIKDIDDPSYLTTPVVTISVLDDDLPGRGSHSFTSQLNLSRF